MRANSEHRLTNIPTSSDVAKRIVSKIALKSILGVKAKKLSTKRKAAIKTISKTNMISLMSRMRLKFLRDPTNLSSNKETESPNDCEESIIESFKENITQEKVSKNEEQAVMTVDPLDKSDHLFEREEEALKEVFSLEKEEKKEGNQMFKEEINQEIKSKKRPSYINKTSIYRISDGHVTTQPEPLEELLPVKKVESIEDPQKNRRRSLFYKMSLTSQKDSTLEEESKELSEKEIQFEDYLEKVEQESTDKADTIKQYLKMQMEIKNKMEEIICNEHTSNFSLSEESKSGNRNYPKLIIKKKEKTLEERITESVFEEEEEFKNEDHHEIINMERPKGRMIEISNNQQPKSSANNQIKRKKKLRNLSIPLRMQPVKPDYKKDLLLNTDKVKEINQFLLKLNTEKQQRKRRKIQKEREFFKKLRQSQLDPGKKSWVDQLEKTRKDQKRKEIAERLRGIEKRKQKREESLRISNKLTKKLLKSKDILKLGQVRAVHLKRRVQFKERAQDRFYNKEYMNQKNNIRFYKKDTQNGVKELLANYEGAPEKQGLDMYSSSFKHSNQERVRKRTGNNRRAMGNSLPRFKHQRMKKISKMNNEAQPEETLKTKKVKLPKLNERQIDYSAKGDKYNEVPMNRKNKENKGYQEIFKRKKEERNRIQKEIESKTNKYEESFAGIKMLKEEIIDVRDIIQEEQKLYTQSMNSIILTSGNTNSMLIKYFWYKLDSLILRET